MLKSDQFISSQIHLYNYHNGDLKQLLNMSDSLFGKGYLDKKEIEIMLNKNYRIIMAKIYDRPVGFYISKEICSPVEIDKGFADYLIEFKEFKIPASYLKMIGVIKHLQLRGIGSIMLNDFIERNTGNFLFTSVWKSKKDNNLLYLLKKLNFTKIAEIANFWETESLERNFICKDCGKPPCQCSMQLFGLAVRRL